MLGMRADQLRLPPSLAYTWFRYLVCRKVVNEPCSCAALIHFKMAMNTLTEEKCRAQILPKLRRMALPLSLAVIELF